MFGDIISDQDQQSQAFAFAHLSDEFIYSPTPFLESIPKLSHLYSVLEP